MLYYKMNTAECRECSRGEADEALFEPIQKILAKGEGHVPGNEDFIVRIHRRGRNAIFSVHRFGVNPIVACAFVAEEADETQLWNGIIKLVPPGSGFHRLDPLMPQSRPWMAEVLLPDHIFVREGISWVHGFCVAMGLSLCEVEAPAR